MSLAAVPVPESPHSSTRPSAQAATYILRDQSEDAPEGPMHLTKLPMASSTGLTDSKSELAGAMTPLITGSRVSHENRLRCEPRNTSTAAVPSPHLRP